MTREKPLLRAQELTTSFRMPGGVVKAVDHVTIGTLNFSDDYRHSILRLGLEVCREAWLPGQFNFTFSY